MICLEQGEYKLCLTKKYDYNVTVRSVTCVSVSDLLTSLFNTYMLFSATDMLKLTLILLDNELPYQIVACLGVLS